MKGIYLAAYKANHLNHDKVDLMFTWLLRCFYWLLIYEKESVE